MINIWDLEKIRNVAIVCRWRYCLGIRLHKTRNISEDSKCAGLDWNQASVRCRFRDFPQQQAASCVSDVILSSLLQRRYADTPQHAI
jgi:hypothetical protein